MTNPNEILKILPEHLVVSNTRRPEADHKAERIATGSDLPVLPNEGKAENFTQQTSNGKEAKQS